MTIAGEAGLGGGGAEWTGAAGAAGGGGGGGGLGSGEGRGIMCCGAGPLRFTTSLAPTVINDLEAMGVCFGVEWASTIDVAPPASATTTTRTPSQDSVVLTRP